MILAIGEFKSMTDLSGVAKAINPLHPGEVIVVSNLHARCVIEGQHFG
jgi:hypothetical protein